MHPARGPQTALVVTLMAAIGMVYYYAAILVPQTRATDAHPTIGRYSFGNDFYQIWLTSRECLFQRLDPYSLDVAHKIQTGIFGHELNPTSPDHPPVEYRAFAYPAFADVLGLPVAWLPFSKARLVLAIVMVILTASSVFLWSRGVGWNAGLSTLLVFIGLILSSYQGLEALYALQPGIIVSFLLAATMAALAANKLRLAGCLLAFSTIKPQVTALLILFLLLWTMASWRKRQKLAFAFLITLATLCLSAMLIWPNWITGWQRAMTKYPSYYSRPPLLDMLGPFFGGALLWLILVATIKFAWDNRQEDAMSFRFGLTVSFLLAITTVTLLPAHAVYDHLILLPAVMLVVRSWRRILERNFISKWILILAAAALFWQWIAASVVIIIRAFAPDFTSAILLLPLRTVLAIPFVTIAMLLLAMRPNKGSAGSFASLHSNL